MKKVCFAFLCFQFALQIVNAQGFSTITNHDPLSLSDKTADKSQAKVWTHDGKWWSVLSSGSATKLFRLDGSKWTAVLTLATSNSKADCRVAGDLVHILLYKGGLKNALLVSVEYDYSTSTYKLWHTRPGTVSFLLPDGAVTASLVVDGNNRMWIATNTQNSINVWWSDSPFTNWSSPITIATGTMSDDNCVLTELSAQNKIGIFWSNKNSKRFGFKTHTDGASPSTWSADEVPASNEAIDNIGGGMADNHMNIKVASDGTLYCITRTSYSKSNYPQLILLVRRPNGIWDNIYPVTMNPEGTQAILLLNETLGKIKVVYTTATNGNIIYRESNTNSIAFGAAYPLIASGSSLYNSPTSTHQSYNSEIVVIATNGGTTPWQTASVLASDATVGDNTPPIVNSINRSSPLTETIQISTVTFRAIFSERVSGVDKSDFVLNVLSGSLNGLVSEVTEVGNGGATYDIVVNSLNGSGEFRIDLKETGTNIKDASQNLIVTGFDNGQTYSLQLGKPILTSVELYSNNANSTIAKVNDKITLEFVASEPINLPVVKIAGHNITPTSGTNNSYTAVYTITNSDIEGNVAFSIDFSNTGGVAGDQVTSTTNNSSVTFDKTNPEVQYINRKTPSTSTISTSTVKYEIKFSEQVVGTDINDFVLTTTGATDGNIASIIGSNNLFEVTVNNISGDGSLRLDLKSGASITDVTGNSIESGYNGQVYTYQQVSTPPTLSGFASITKLNPLPIKISTAHKPQFKVWKYDNRWWAVLSTSNGTGIYRLDGNSWAFVLKVASTTRSRADIRLVDNLVHLLLFRGSSDISYIASVEYDSNAKTYKLWSVRKSLVNIDLPDGAEVATIEVDGEKRMWMAYDAVTDIYVQWSDAPYSTWSAPIKIASGVKSDDISAITKLPGKVGVFWSNQNTKRFGFRTHVDGTSPSSWTADELPASQSAIDNIGAGFADDHMNLKVASDGTLYCAAKTSYNRSGYPQLILLVRRPNGSWDNVYPVTNGPEGTQAIAVLNEIQGKIKVVYTTSETGGDILYRESFTSNIAFNASKKLISESGSLFNNSTSTFQSYNPSIVILTTRISPTPLHAYGVLASDEISDNNTVIAASPKPQIQIDDIISRNDDLKLLPNPIYLTGDLTFSLDYASSYTVTLFDARGGIVKRLRQGFAEANTENVVKVDAADLNGGIYFIRLQTDREFKVIKMLKHTR